MIMILVEALAVFFIYGSKWFFSFLAASYVYTVVKDKRFNTAALLLLVYMNIWILGSITSLFNGGFDILILVRILATEASIFALSYLVVAIMTPFATSDTKLIDYPGAFLCGLLAVPVIEMGLQLIYNIIGFIIIA